MSGGKGGVGIPVNIGGSTPTISSPNGGSVNLPKNLSNPMSASSPKSNNIPNHASNLNHSNIPNNVSAALSSASGTDLQQRQRLLMQQRALQQQQALQNFENQFFQLLMTLNKKPKRLYNFVEETDLVLHKYEQYRPSFEFHVYENNYKICAPANSRLQQPQNGHNKPNNVIHNDGLILTKNNATLKEFLEYVARGRIPEAIMEVLRDSNIQFYEGNLILQVYDHTNTVEVVANKLTDKKPTTSNNSTGTNIPRSTSNASVLNTNTQSPNVKSVSSTPNIPNNNTQTSPEKPSTPNTTTNTATIPTATNINNTTPAVKKPVDNMQPKTFRRPRVYRTLLRPNDLTNYYDMMTYADQARFSDSIYQQFESEILNLTKRNIKLDVDLNPYDHCDKVDEEEFTEPKFNEETHTMEFEHREESTKEGTKGQVGHIAEHEELPQNTSNYEQLMLIMSERTSTITNSTFATAIAQYSMNANGGSHFSNGSGSGNNLSSSRNSSISLSSALGTSSNGNKSTGQGSNSVNAAAAAAVAAVGANNENNQFTRLKFIEQWKVDKEKRKQQMALNINGNNGSNGTSSGSSVAGTPFTTKISMTVPMTPQKQFLQQQQQLKQASEKKIAGKGGKRGATKDGDKPKPKRPRKTKKNADGTQQTPKRKRVPKKKQTSTTNSTATNSTAASPTSQSPS